MGFRFRGNDDICVIWAKYFLSMTHRWQIESSNQKPVCATNKIIYKVGDST